MIGLRIVTEDFLLGEPGFWRANNSNITVEPRDILIISHVVPPHLSSRTCSGVKTRFREVSNPLLLDPRGGLIGGFELAFRPLWV